MNADPDGWIAEVFGSIQGEGVHVGRRHIFVRLAGCGFGCRYCDQPEAERTPSKARFEVESGSGRFREMANPLSASAVVDSAAGLDKPRGLHHAVSVTGGEPLEQPVFLQSLLRRLKASGFRILLETNGVHPERLADVVADVDIVSMDYKLESATGRPTPADRHRRFLQIAHGRDLYVKAVVCADTQAEELRQAASVIASVDPDIPLVIQPEAASRPDTLALLGFHEVASAEIRDVRVIGQMHRALGMR